MGAHTCMCSVHRHILIIEFLKFNSVYISGVIIVVSFVLQHRKELVDAIRHGWSVLKSDMTVSSIQSRMPSYGTQVLAI